MNKIFETICLPSILFLPYLFLTDLANYIHDEYFIVPLP